MVFYRRVGYIAGNIAADVVWYGLSGTVAVKTVKTITKFAGEHKIDVTSEDAVTENVFECLKYVE